MTFKKIMLLASMAMAAVAFAAPAAQAEAPQWTHEGVAIEGEEELHIVGELSSQIAGSNFVTGPCEITFVGTASNSGPGGAAHGVITGGTIQHECQTNVEGCTITPTLLNFPWTVTGTTVTGQQGVAIDNATFLNHYIGTCPVPVTTIAASGTATGIVEEGCLSFEGHQDDMALEAPFPPAPANILGGVCDTTLELG
jgi:hypothetical protein